jgi:hypothetical protein
MPGFEPQMIQPVAQYCTTELSRDTSVSIKTRQLVGRPWTNVQQDWHFFSSPPRPDRLWGPPSLLSNGYQGLFSPGVNWLGNEAVYSPASSPEVKNARSYTSTPQYVFMKWYLFKHRDNFTFMCVCVKSDLSYNTNIYFVDFIQHSFTAVQCFFFFFVVDFTEYSFIARAVIAQLV